MVMGSACRAGGGWLDDDGFFFFPLRNPPIAIALTYASTALDLLFFSLKIWARVLRFEELI